MRKVLLVAFGGFLGAGKTTAMTCLADSLRADGKRTAIVVNDQGEGLVDTAFGRATGLPVAEVTGGCFCCRFDDLVTTSIGLVEQENVEIVLAEAVGSCTDLTATVIRPLRAYFGKRFVVAPLTVLIDPSRLRDLDVVDPRVGALMPYLFDKQLEDGRILVLNKLDLLDAAEHAALESELRHRFPEAEVLSVSAATGRGMQRLRERLLSAVGDNLPEPGVRTIDYATYAAAEAELGWLNAQIMVLQPDANTSSGSAGWLRAFTTEVSEVCARADLWIGHVKAYMDTPNGGSKASVLRAGAAPSFDLEDPRAFVEARVLLNARVRAQPGDLDEVVHSSLARVDEQLRTTSTVEFLRSFSPPPPRPTHRLAFSDAS